MNTQSLFTAPDCELVECGHLACSGCGEALGLRLVLKVLGKRTVMVIPACCATVVDGVWPHSSVDVPLLHTAFETAAATAAGVRAALDHKGEKDVNVLAWAGDGGTFDIGIQALSSTAERNENYIYICYDNEAYMNTGIQRSSATPLGSWTTTTPVKNPKTEPKKNIIDILAAHRVPYLATATVGHPDDLLNKVKKAKKTKGFRFIHFLSPCPPGWKSPADKSIELCRLAVEARVFPLIEVHNGRKYVLNYEPKKQVSVEEYIHLQGRFKHLKKRQIATIQDNVDREWDFLLKRVEFSRGL
ncbi:MAG: 3-methyl-2-oxobutanoate dehydrogenase subunit beta [candidate division Zixibacteria bacterium]|nr:3-methyl-2-oxobutanoate dehydrogenase subunit beta [candidate division Zixibacteria bacterium]MBU1471247.1 3-methyl-2-oxobutanoate dehydrogenase subunit beta [candidate division Zixibacteria bacterium]MBU2624949.1 3-methyl-2-oxobutanoate dehydrogenase subunit beta [candidate division Zixibacteria bacterium]